MCPGDDAGEHDNDKKQGGVFDKFHNVEIKLFKNNRRYQQQIAKAITNHSINGKPYETNSSISGKI